MDKRYSKLMVIFSCRCNVVINFFENAHKVTVSEDNCEDCQSALLDVQFNKVGFPSILRVNRAPKSSAVLKFVSL